jgi:hypothetical protein
MAIEIFNKMLIDGVKKGQIPARTKVARDWFRDTASKAREIGQSALLREKTAQTSRVEIGRMYMFMYDPKTKNDLPYYDRFPLIFVINKTADGFLGINLHYLPHLLRAKLMDMLYNYVIDPRLDENTKLKISYQTLNRAATHKYIQPCIKRYLYSHVRSKFVYVVPVEWDIALFLPIENFAKASKTRVWRDSTNMVNKR